MIYLNTYIFGKKLDTPTEGLNFDTWPISIIFIWGTPPMPLFLRFSFIPISLLVLHLCIVQWTNQMEFKIVVVEYRFKVGYHRNMIYKISVQIGEIFPISPVSSTMRYKIETFEVNLVDIDLVVTEIHIYGWAGGATSTFPNRIY